MTKELIERDHTEDIDNQLLSQYRTTVKYKSFVTSFLQSLNDVETDLLNFKEDLGLAKAVGVSLDNWGTILNSKSRPSSDSEFRGNLFALVFAYNSQGRTSDVYQLFANITSSTEIQIREVYPAKFQVHLKEPGNPDYQFLFRALKLAKPAGVGYLPISTSPLTPTFAFDLDQDVDALGFSVIGGSDGGYYSILQSEG